MSLRVAIWNVKEISYLACQNTLCCWKDTCKNITNL